MSRAPTPDLLGRRLGLVRRSRPRIPGPPRAAPDRDRRQGLTRHGRASSIPRRSTSLRHDPTGLDLTVGGATEAAPFTRRVIVGSANSLSADSPQTIGGVAYAGRDGPMAEPRAMTSRLRPCPDYTATYAATTDLSVSQTAAARDWAGHVHGHHAQLWVGRGVEGGGRRHAALEAVVLRVRLESGCTFAAATRQVTCPIGTLAAGAPQRRRSS